MYRHGCGPAIGILQENVTAPGAVYEKARLLKGADYVLPRTTGKTGHTEICWMPTSSREPGSAFCSSRQSWITSRTRFIRVSRFLAWEWQP